MERYEVGWTFNNHDRPVAERWKQASVPVLGGNGFCLSRRLYTLLGVPRASRIFA